MANEKVVRMNYPEVGQRVRLRHRVDRFPEFTVPAGTTGTINEVTDSLISVKMDEAINGAEDWGNCLHFYDAKTFGDPDSDAWDHFAQQVEFLV